MRTPSRDPHLETLFRDGWRSVLAVPMLRGDEMVGALVIRRRGTGSFPPDVIELLQTFASQSALAIVNAASVPRAGDQDQRARGRQPVTSRSSWPACPTSCGPR